MRSLRRYLSTPFAFMVLLSFAACNHPWFSDYYTPEQFQRRQEQKSREQHREWLRRELPTGRRRCIKQFVEHPFATRDIYRTLPATSPSEGDALRQCLSYGGERFSACIRSIPGAGVREQQCPQNPTVGCREFDVAIAAFNRGEEVTVPAWDYPVWSQCALPDGWAVIPARSAQEELADEAAEKQQAEAAQQHLQVRQQCLAQCESSRGLCDNGCLTRFPNRFPNEGLQYISARNDCSRGCFSSHASCRSQCP